MQSFESYMESVYSKNGITGVIEEISKIYNGSIAAKCGDFETIIKSAFVAYQKYNETDNAAEDKAVSGTSIMDDWMKYELGWDRASLPECDDFINMKLQDLCVQILRRITATNKSLIIRPEVVADYVKSHAEVESLYYMAGVILLSPLNLRMCCAFIYVIGYRIIKAGGTVNTVNINMKRAPEYLPRNLDECSEAGLKLFGAL